MHVGTACHVDVDADTTDVDVYVADVYVDDVGDVDVDTNIDDVGDADTDDVDVGTGGGGVAGVLVYACVSVRMCILLAAYSMDATGAATYRPKLCAISPVPYISIPRSVSAPSRSVMDDNICEM